MRPRRALLIAASVAAALALAGCTPAAPTGPAAPVDAGAGSASPDPVDSATPTPTAAAAPTCDTIIPKSTADDFRSLGWSVQSEPFRVGEIALDGGIQCKWGDQKITTDRIQLFGWAPIDDADAAKAEKSLVASGWRREDGPNGTYVTENPDWVISKDADGYGITYLFGDGWVKLADTRQSLVLVDAPR